MSVSDQSVGMDMITFSPILSRTSRNHHANIQDVMSVSDQSVGMDIITFSPTFPRSSKKRPAKVQGVISLTMRLRPFAPAIAPPRCYVHAYVIMSIIGIFSMHLGGG